MKRRTLGALRLNFAVMLLFLVSALPSLAAQTYEGTYTTYVSTKDGSRSVTLTLLPAGKAVMREVVNNQRIPTPLLGTWMVVSDNKIDVEVSLGSRSEEFTFRRLENGALVSTRWDEDVWGSNELTFAFTKLTIADQVAIGPEGTYLLRTSTSSGDELWILNLDSAKRATLVNQSSRTPATSTGTWDMTPNGSITINVSRGNIRDRMTFRPSVDLKSLTATSWDRGDWGRNAPVFTRSANRPPIENPMGNWRMNAQDTSGNRIQFTLVLKENGTAQLLTNVNRQNSVSRRLNGSWIRQKDGRIRAVFDNPEWLVLVFRQEGDTMKATTWDREELGEAAPAFTRTSQ